MCSKSISPIVNRNTKKNSEKSTKSSDRQGLEIRLNLPLKDLPVRHTSH
jgi:hypothetical protein